MKKTLLALVCFSLVLACLGLRAAEKPVKEYHLIETQMLDSDYTNGSPLTVYVLVMPDNTRPWVFKTFASKEMQTWVGSLPKGSRLIYDANRFLPMVPADQVEVLAKLCQDKGISFSQFPYVVQQK